MSAVWQRIAAILGFAAVSSPLSAAATYSILAVDVRDGTVGGAVASCVPLETVARVYGSVPGKGALVTQSYLKDDAMPDGLAWIGSGSVPDVVLARLIDPAYDADFDLRQYAVVTVDGRAVSFTGTGASPHASHVVFSTADFSVAIQGNYLTGPAVIDQARAAFETEGSCDLPERLMQALEAAGANGSGDARCVAEGAPAESALLEVDPPGQTAGSFLRLGVPAQATDGIDPVPLLRGAFDAWRREHPCPAPDPGVEPVPPVGPGAPEEPGCAVSRAPAGSPMPLILLGLVAAARAARHRRRT